MKPRVVIPDTHSCSSFPRLRPFAGKAAGQATAKAGQAAIELAVFGAILIFILGTIVRSAVGNGYAQNENFKAMRMAMLASWQGSESNPGQNPQNISHNSASILFVEDRLSPDFNKYGDVDRNPFIAQGSGIFSYNLLYPWQPGVDSPSNLVPIMDVWINGQHFPFTTAAYVVNNPITRPACSADGPYPPGGGLTRAQCLQNQCLRNAREWAGGTVNESQFYNIVNPPVAVQGCPITAPPQDIDIECDAYAIFHELAKEGFISPIGGSESQVASVNSSALTSTFTGWLEDPSTFPGANVGQAQVDQVQSILQSSQNKYKLFYTMQVNGTPQFSPTPPASCSGTNNALCSSLALPFTTCPTISAGLCVNTNGDMQYDLPRNGDYTAVDSQFPPVASCLPDGGTPNMRCYVAWQWAATPGTTAASIGLDTESNKYPNYDIDGRLKSVTIYAISQNPDGTPNVTYEDYQGGDIDASWDPNSCSPKPGLQSGSQIFTFTKEGTYLKILEGKLYNPETDQFVRSQNKRDTADLIQRTIQLSNNTGRFCAIPPATGYGSLGSPPNNPVEVCVDGTGCPDGPSCNCFSTEQNIKSTCYDVTDNMIFVRSRLEDRRGHFWMTDASGQLKVQ